MLWYLKFFIPRLIHLKSFFRDKFKTFIYLFCILGAQKSGSITEILKSKTHPNEILRLYKNGARCKRTTAN